MMENQDSSSITPVNSTAPPSIMETTEVPAVEEGSKEQPIPTGREVEVDKPYMKRPCPGSNNNDNRNKQKKQKKNKASKPDLYKIAYENVSFVPIPSTGRPGTPHSLFQESYTVHWKKEQNDGAVVGDDDQVEVKDTPQQFPQIVHKHANGLVIVTAGNQFKNTASETAAAAKLIESVNYLIKEAPALNAGERRKIQSKMMHNKKITDGVVNPSSIMCRVVTTAAAVVAADESDEKKNETNNSGVPLYSCVWGAVMEINARLLPALLESETQEEKIKSPNSSSAAEPNLLAKDPLLDGYLAIILPTGPFPPKEQDDERRT
jgi:hypothetical protein